MEIKATPGELAGRLPRDSAASTPTIRTLTGARAAGSTLTAGALSKAAALVVSIGPDARGASVAGATGDAGASRRSAQKARMPHRVAKSARLVRPR
jgi:hypothetical protein